MYITEVKTKTKSGKTSHRCFLLRESYREGGKVKNRTLANFTHCKPEEIKAMELALKHKGDLSVLGSLQEEVELREGSSIGAVWVIYEVARRLGIEKSLGRNFGGKLALWQVMARVLDQGSRLSAVRLARTHGACEVLNFSRGFDENDLYANLRWLSENQSSIEKRLFSERRGGGKPELFLYDVTSSYLEGQCNELAAYGYNRDGKKGKKQVVIGLLCDQEGEPVSTEVFAGNTRDMATFSSQVEKAARLFGCERVTMVGDRGMIKSGQIDALSEFGFNYITALTKPQIKTLLHSGTLQMSLFDQDVCEVEEGGVRYILRRNPYRAQEMAASREDKKQSVAGLMEGKNGYLKQHPRAQVPVALRDVQARIERLRIGNWLRLEAEGRTLSLHVDEAALKEAALLDGCYVIKTDLPGTAADKQVVHDRYKDLTRVERAFRTMKTGHLEVRPVYVRTEESTRGHVLVVMLSYLIVRELSRRWAHLDLTVEEGLNQLATLCAVEVNIKGKGSFCRIPKPREKSRILLEALNVNLPQVLPKRKVNVVSRKKLQQQR